MHHFEAFSKTKSLKQPLENYSIFNVAPFLLPITFCFQKQKLTLNNKSFIPEQHYHLVIFGLVFFASWLLDG